MNPSKPPAFRCTTITDTADSPCADAWSVLAMARRLPVWDAVTIAPESGNFPRANITWHEGHGFVVQCFENDTSPGYFLARNEPLSSPIVEIELGPHHERWPSQLFVSSQGATEGLDVFLATGTQKATLNWDQERRVRSGMRYLHTVCRHVISSRDTLHLLEPRTHALLIRIMVADFGRT